SAAAPVRSIACDDRRARQSLPPRVRLRDVRARQARNDSCVARSAFNASRRQSMRHVWSAVCACLVGVSSSVASAQTVSDCEAQGKFLVTAYGFADNDPAYSDAIATVGQNSNWRANFSMTNTFDNPSTLAVPSSWLDGTGNFSEGDRVFVE